MEHLDNIKNNKSYILKKWKHLNNIKNNISTYVILEHLDNIKNSVEAFGQHYKIMQVTCLRGDSIWTTLQNHASYILKGRKRGDNIIFQKIAFQLKL